MVRDLILDMKERDLLTEDKSIQSLPVYDVVWGNILPSDEEGETLICNVLVPVAYWQLISYDGNGELLVRFNSKYIPDTRTFRLRLLKFYDGGYGYFNNIRGDLGVQVKSYALSRNIASPIKACQLPLIDLDGEFIVKIMKNVKEDVEDRACIYSAKATDLTINYSDDQAAQLLSLCGPGKSYRYPTTGVNITKYLNSVVKYTDLEKMLEEQFAADGRPLQSAEFDPDTGKLDVLFNPERPVEDTGLGKVSIDEFDKFTDEFVRRNITLSEASYMDFVNMLNDYESILSLYIFKDAESLFTRIANMVEPGRFDSDGNIIPDNDYVIVSATLEPDSMIMFDDEEEDMMTENPVFIINEVDETRLYTSLVGQPYWLTAECHKCMVMRRRAEVKYMIKKERFTQGKGLYLVPPISENIKNMVGLVQDSVTGRLIGIVSDNTNISDITLDEITQHIYATQIAI